MIQWRPDSVPSELVLLHIYICIFFRDDNQWLCTFCVFKLTEECRYPDEQRTEAVMSRQISQHMLVSIFSSAPVRKSVHIKTCRSDVLLQLISPVSPGQECQYLLLYLCSADEEQIFATDPREYVSDFSRLSVSVK